MKTIVPATADHATDAAALIYATDPAVWNYLFASSRENFNRYAEGLWLQPGNNFSHTESVGIYDKGELVALEMGYKGSEELSLRHSMLNAVADILDASVLHSLSGAAEDIEYLTAYIPDNVYYLHFLSVSHSKHGQGLGKLLLTNAIGRAETMNCHAVHLDVYSDNPAVGVYLSFGFRIVVKTEFPNKAGLPPHYRMVREL